LTPKAGSRGDPQKLATGELHDDDHENDELNENDHEKTNADPRDLYVHNA
jgi:hypothetical protein